MESIIAAVIVAIVSTITGKFVERISTKPSLAENTEQAINLQQRAKFFKRINGFLYIFTIGFSLFALIFIWFQQTYFPVVTGCVTITGMRVRVEPGGNPTDYLPAGCYSFDAQSDDGKWMRVKDERSSSLNHGWVEASVVKTDLCKLEKGKYDSPNWLCWMGD